MTSASEPEPAQEAMQPRRPIVRDLGLDVLLDDGVDGRVESIGAGQVVVTGDWSDGAGLILRPGCLVVVLTRAAYNDLIDRSTCGECY
ncbi:hypothetical protein [Nocardia brasiliensis]|uniref:hypothetical protein n=1 Tax=Nocardia brasiliensis TaxID=37326 RepID=UPI0024577B16|nr:hypothetical protein [Nocardia brasiliensis]